MKTFCLLLAAFFLLLSPSFVLSETAVPDPGKIPGESRSAPAEQVMPAGGIPPAAQLAAADAAPAKGGAAAEAPASVKPNADQGKAGNEGTGVKGEGEGEEEVAEAMAVADPLEPFNRIMFNFNDKLYFWVLKPAAKGYNRVVPEGARVSVSNFFSNVTTPIRFVNSLLQLKIKAAGTELARLVVNSTAGMGGLFDVAKEWNLLKQDEDTGQTLGHYGMKEVFYIVWPFFGPSNVRDTIGTVGDGFLNPADYIRPVAASVGVQAYEKLNATSLHLGEYEDLKESAIDPYIAVRDAYTQNRRYKITGE